MFCLTDSEVKNKQKAKGKAEHLVLILNEKHEIDSFQVIEIYVRRLRNRNKEIQFEFWNKIQVKKGIRLP